LRRLFSNPPRKKKRRHANRTEEWCRYSGTKGGGGASYREGEGIRERRPSGIRFLVFSQKKNLLLGGDMGEGQQTPRGEDWLDNDNTEIRKKD